MKLSVHPLFFAVMLFCALFGGLPSALICLMTALLHESGHIFCAARMGFKCEKVKIMPYGAAAMCDVDGIRAGDEIKLALAGPAVNAAVCVALAGLWWFFPQTYAYTDAVFSANAVMFCINLLPAHPLDGGRALKCLLRKFFRPKTVSVLTRCLSAALAAAFVLIFFLAYKNFSLLIFAVFLLCSAFEKDVPLSRINFAAKKPKRGKEIKHVMLNANSTFKDALRHTDSSKYVIFQFYGDGLLDEIYEDELYAMLQTRTIYDKILE